MKSPFPGMDPYLELHWGDVHHRLIQYAADVLQGRLPDDLRARVEERVYVEGGEAPRQILPDVHVAEVPSWSGGGAAVAVAEDVAVAAPFIVESPDDPVTEGFIEIRERGGGRLVTMIEFLSPGNKVPGTGRNKYREKQAEALHSTANLVEIDLVRAGSYTLAAPVDWVPEEMRRQFLACISPAGWMRTRFELYTMPLRQRLPALALPLRDTDPRVTLDLQALVAQVYTAGRYSDLDYTAALDQPLPPDDQSWLQELLRDPVRRSA